MKRGFTISLLILSACYLLKGDLVLRDSDLSYRFNRLGGGYSTLNEFDSEIILLYFFTSYCLPCIKDIQFFQENKEYFTRTRVSIIGIGMDYNGEITLVPFVEFNKINFPVMLADRNITEGKWGFGKINTIPAAILIQRKEKRYRIHTGTINREVISSFR